MKIDFEEFFKEERIAAVLHIWYLSGNIHCCEIYRFPENFNYTKITYPCDLEKFRIKHSDNFWLDYRKMLTENFNHFNDKHLIRELTKQIGISHLGKAQKTLYTNHLFAEMRNRFDMSEFHKDILELSRKVFLQDVITVFLLGEKVYKKYKFEEN
ncbi:MAG: hypothetical protein H8E84_05210 [Flavobacteriales bacterium]|nr:hypothetical protein [Flavobacteriales bacterium]